WSSDVCSSDLLIETVGVGQTELDIARTAESTALVLVPESGDGIQTLKAGVMEIADVYVVNKADRPGADKLRQEVEVMLGIRQGNAFRHITPHHRPTASDSRIVGRSDGKALRSDNPIRPSDWVPPVLATVAVKGEGIAELAGFNPATQLGEPGRFPFTRGIHPTMYRGRLWTMRQFSGFGSAEDTNRRYKFLLEHGQTGLSVAFDFPTLMGYDSDHPRAEGEVGKCGVAIASLADMEDLFHGIPLDHVSTSMT